MRKYNSYKSSGVEWIGDIPEKWDLIKLKYISNLYNGSSLNDNQKELFESSNMDDIPYVSTKDIDYNTQSIEYDNGLRIPKSNTSFKLGKKGSFLLCIEGGSSGKKMGFLEQDVYFVNKLCCFEPKTNGKYQYYLIQTPLFQTQFYSSLSGLIGGVSISLIRNFISITPPLQEQEQIVKYLDEKTSIIDKLISIKQRKVELLQEQRTTLINQVITKGLNPNVKMKDSGVEWIGEIPESWVIKKMKYFVRICNGGDFKDFTLEDGGFPVYGSGGIFSRSSKFIYDKISVLLGRKGSVDKPKIVEEPFWCSDTTYYTKIKENVNPYYFFFLVQQIKFDLYTYGSTIPSMTKSVYDEMLFPYPNFQEQQEIVEYLDTHTKEIDDLVSMEQKKIELLKEYRQSLISEVITGKLKVM
jgi:type I restriction enzyme S subunit